MARIEKSIELDVPVHAVYNQLIQFEKFPEFMAHVREVRRTGDKQMHWRAEVGGKEVEWDAEISEQVPDQRIAWRNTQGPQNSGDITLAPLGDGHSRLTYVLELESVPGSDKKAPKPEEMAARTEQDLQSFKRFVEGNSKEDSGREGGAREGSSLRGSTQGAQAAESIARASRTVADETSQIGRRAFQTASDNFSRAGQQASEFASQAWRSQHAIQSSALEAANAALRPFRSGPFGSQPWFSSMLTAFDEPLSVMRRFSEEMQHELDGLLARNRVRLGSSSLTSWAPKVDVSQREGQLIVHADLPGIRREDVSVEVQGDQLVIRGERRHSQEHDEQGQHRVECSYGEFTRVIPLPDEVLLEQSEATVADGVLEIKLPLVSAQQRAHRIEVRNRNEQQAQKQAESAAESAPQRNAAQKNQPQRNAA